MHKDFYLRFANEAEWITQSTSVGIRTTGIDHLGNEYIGYSVGTGAVDIVGTIYNDDVVFNDDFTVKTPATPMTGYHVNLRLEYKTKDGGVDSDGKEKLVDDTLPSGLSSYVVTPSTPNRIFA